VLSATQPSFQKMLNNTGLRHFVQERTFIFYCLMVTIHSMTLQETTVKMAPNSKESEMMVLGCMLTSINGLNIAADTLDDSDFYYT
jgi:hypothetical protein